MKLFSVLALLLGLAGQSHGATLVTIGDTGSVIFPVANYSLSTLPLSNVRIATSAPAYFNVLGTSDLGPASIAPGTTHNFQIDYQIASTSDNGSFNLVLNVGVGSPGTMVVPNTLPMSTTVNFLIGTSSPSCTLQNIARSLLADVVQDSVAPVIQCDNSVSGICSIKFETPDGVIKSTADFRSAPTAELGPYPQLSTGTYTFIAEDCVGHVTRSTFSITLSTGITKACIGKDSFCSVVTIDTPTVRVGSMTLTFSPDDSCSDSSDCDQLCQSLDVTCSYTGCYTVPFSTSTPYPAGIASKCRYSHIVKSTFTINNPMALPNQITAKVDIYDSSGSLVATASTETVSYSWTVMYGTVTAPDVGNTIDVASPDGVARLGSYFWGVGLAATAPESHMFAAILNNLFAQFGLLYTASGSEFAFSSGTLISFSSQVPAGVIVDTSTLNIYRFDGASWSTGSIANQYIHLSGSSLLTATGTTTQSGTYGLFYQGHDSSAPVTNFVIQGSSYTFDGTLIVSTDSFIVLSATDPIVNGFASTVSTTYYRIDPTTGTAYSIYTSSIIAPFGRHLIQYRSQDYAGNFESTKTATFLVTAGTIMKASADVLVVGKMFNGDSDSGFQAEIESRAENDYTLLISSADASTLATVALSGGVGLGLSAAGTLDVAASPAAVGALGLRSGNTTSYASAQIAFGYNGTTEMRHVLRTEHSTDTAGNRMDFLIWETGAGSTTTLARMPVMSLQAITAASGGSVHIMPVGTPDVELEVSDGLTTGGGTIRRGAALAPSSREFKSDIRYLDDKAYEKALEDVRALKHAQFRYKRRGHDGGLVVDSRAPLREGLIYEDTPESVHGDGESVSLDERIVNLEMALKSRLRRMRDLEKRLRVLREGR
jgi:hypothetical protein